MSLACFYWRLSRKLATVWLVISSSSTQINLHGWKKRKEEDEAVKETVREQGTMVSVAAGLIRFELNCARSCNRLGGALRIDCVCAAIGIRLCAAIIATAVRTSVRKCKAARLRVRSSVRCVLFSRSIDSGWAKISRLVHLISKTRRYGLYLRF